jgi:hypothetical protein
LNKATIHIILFLFFIVTPQIKGLAQKTDTIVHVNGNVLKGDFKKMEYGIITWKMDGMGTINVEQPFIDTFISKKQFEIVMKNGLIYYSSLEASDSNREVVISVDGQKESIYIDDIVEAHPIKNKFWMKISGNLSLGGNYSKGSNLTTIAFSGNLDYRNKKTFYQTNWNLNTSYQGDSLTALNTNINLQWQRMFKNQWSSLILVGMSQNLQLGTKRRYDLSLGGVKDIIYNTWNRFYVTAALSGITETPYEPANASQQDLAGALSVAYEIYKYTSPKISLQTSFNFIPYFTGEERYRAAYNLNPSISILNNNFKVGFNFYFNYDSNPAEGSLSNDDYGINLQLTYSLH